jgi:Undecaprenyl-phosphate galactose phosphotransferase WbaP
MATKAQVQKDPTLLVRPCPSPWLTALSFLVSDTLALTLSAVFALEFWQIVNPGVSQFFLEVWPAMGLLLVIYAWEGLYPGVGMTSVEELRRLVRATTLVYLFVTAAIFLLKDVGAHSRGVFASGWVLSVILVPFSRAMVCQFLSPKHWWGAPVVVLGAGQTAAMVIRELKAKRAIGFKPVACLDDDSRKIGDCEGVPVLGPLAMANNLARTHKIRHAILAMPGIHRERLIPLLEECSAVFPNVILVPDLFGVSSLWVEPRDLGGVLGLQLRHNLLVPFNRWMKRAADIVLGGLASLLALPLIAVAVAWIKLVSPGNAFFFQEREGEGGQLIRIPKLRTMYPDAEALLQNYLEDNPQARSHWERYCKLQNDPRVLPGIGKLLRRTSLDELPQLWSIIKGEMSLVGPRPFPVYHNQRFHPDFRTLRTKVTPGLTGLWQISERSDGDLYVQAKLDTYYIRNWSLWLDIYILSRTLRAVIMAKGAY